MLPKVVDGSLKLLLTLALVGCTNPLARVTRGLNNHTKRKLMSFDSLTVLSELILFL